MSPILKQCVQVCSYGIFLTGLMALIGHTFDWTPFYAPIPAKIGMAPNTAFAFTLTGLALWILATLGR